jgi:hypothetical protein
MATWVLWLGAVVMARLSKEAHTIYMRRYRLLNKEKLKQNHLRHRVTHSERIRARHFLKKYGITLEERNRIFVSQEGKCGICRKELDMDTHGGASNKPNVDHCHQTGKVRGILCKHCNTALGVLGDSEQGILRVLAYLRKADG